ncbi:MAG: sugar phosphate isomerase/epimerase, partial [Chloroflexota bacterium]
MRRSCARPGDRRRYATLESRVPLESMKLGIYSRSLPLPPDATASAQLQAVHELGLDGCLFPSPLALSPTLDPVELRERRQQAEALGLYLELGLGQINPFHFDRAADVLAVGDGDFRAGLERMLRAASAIGVSELFFWAGTVADRASRSVPWGTQLAALEAFLRDLAPLARDLGCHLNLKTHEEITTHEVVRLVEAVGPDVLGVSLDPVNVVVRLEDPLASARRVAPYVRQVHLDDALILFDEQGLVRKLRPCGEGAIDWPAILGLVRAHRPAANLTIELHRGQFGMPIYDRDWLALQPEGTLGELAELVRLAVASRGRLERGETAPIEAYEGDATLRLRPTVAFWRGLLEEPA